MNDLRFAFRQLLKNPGFTAGAVLTLALGIGANTAIFSVINGVLLKPLPHPEPERLIRLFENSKSRNLEFIGLSAPAFNDWRAQNTVFEDMAAFQVGGFDLTGVPEPVRLSGARVSASLFPLLRVNPVLGRSFNAEDDTVGSGRVVIISHRLWQERYAGRREVLGEGVTLNGNPYSVVGVMPAGFRPDGLDTDLWVPMAFEPFEVENRGGHNYDALARLKPEVSLAQAQSAMDAIAERLGLEHELARGWGATVVPMRELIVGGSRKPLLILFGAVGFVLLIACANVANLLLARAVARGREMAVRLALGAGRGRIIRQLLTESALLAVCGALLGSLLAAWMVQLIVKTGALPRLENVRLDLSSLAFTIVMCLFTVLVFGVVPAWLTSRTSPAAVLKDGARGSTSVRRQRFRSACVVTQVALAIVLLVGSGLLLRSFARLRAVDLGFQTEHILTATFAMSDARFPGRDEQRIAFAERLREHVSTLPGVDSAATVMGLPLAFGGARSEVFVEGRPEPQANEPRAAGYSQISANYFQTIGATLARGRHFDRRDTVDAPFVAIVNEAFVRTFLPGEDPIGRMLKVMDSQRERPTEIVGVVRDIRQRVIAAPAGPEMYFPITQRCWFDVQLVVRTHTEPAAMAETLRRAVAEVDSAQTLSAIRTLDSITESALETRRLQMTLLGGFAGGALLLAAIGIYGVMASVVAGRTHEIGIRMSLGARTGHVLGLVLQQGMKVASIGIIVGLAGAFALTRLLRSLVFEISPTDPLTFALVPLLLASVALLACWLPARRAARVDPMEALRSE